MKILDRYLIKQFLQILFFAFIAFILIFVIIDMMENLDDFIDESVAGQLIIQYYFVFIPEIVRIITPIAVLLASLFTAGKMATQNELTAIKASGVSLYRFMAPFILTVFLISLISVYFGGFLVPEANKRKVFIEQNYMKKGLVQFGSNIFFQDDKNRIVSISYFDVVHQQANQISIQEFNPNEITKIVRRTDASRMQYDSSKSVWKLYDGVSRIFTDSSETLQNFAMIDYPNLFFKPQDVVKKQRKPEEMTFAELNSFTEEQKRTGNNTVRIELEYHSRIAYAFSSLVIVLFGLPISANRRRGGMAMQFGINMVITFVYLSFIEITKAFGTGGILSPMLTGWLANIVFFTAAVINTLRANK